MKASGTAEKSIFCTQHRLPSRPGLIIRLPPRLSKMSAGVAHGEERINSLHYIFPACVILDAHRNITAAPPGDGTSLFGQAHLVHFLDEAFQQLGVAAREHELDHVAADLSGQQVPM